MSNLDWHLPSSLVILGAFRAVSVCGPVIVGGSTGCKILPCHLPADQSGDRQHNRIQPLGSIGFASALLSIGRAVVIRRTFSVIELSVIDHRCALPPAAMRRGMRPSD